MWKKPVFLCYRIIKSLIHLPMKRTLKTTQTNLTNNKKGQKKKWIFWTWLCMCCQGTRFQESFTSVLSATLYLFQSNAVIPISQSSSSIYILASSNLWFSHFHDNKCLVQIYEYDIQISCLKTSVKKKKTSIHAPGSIIYFKFSYLWALIRMHSPISASL